MMVFVPEIILVAILLYILLSVMMYTTLRFQEWQAYRRWVRLQKQEKCTHPSCYHVICCMCGELNDSLPDEQYTNKLNQICQEHNERIPK